MAVKRVLTDEQVGEVTELLLSGESTTSVGEVYGCSNSAVYDAARGAGLIYKGSPGHGKWVRASDPPLASATELDQRVAQLRGDLSGKTEVSGTWIRDLGRAYGLSRAMCQRTAHAAGFEFVGTNQFDGVWKRKQEDTAVTNGEWNMDVDDYNALLTSEREQEAANDDQAEYEASEAEHVPDAHPALLMSDDDDLRAAARLLDQAAEQRRGDVLLITDLERRMQAYAEEIEEQSRRIVQLETENKRLTEQIKVEISRGFLRQSMDNLRSVLK